MTDTTFVDGDLATSNRIVAAWLNDVNDTVYTALGSGGVAPTTAQAVKTNLGFSVAGLGDYANDAAAAGGGVAVGALYRNGSVLMIRVA